MKMMLVVGNDRIARKAIRELGGEISSLLVVRDVSSGFRRAWKLVHGRRLPLSLLVRMAACELSRENNGACFRDFPVIRNNRELVRLIGQYKPGRILLFRAGLVISRSVLETGVPVWNIHCARVPGYGGLGSIARALRDRAHDQCATLHEVTERIDAGRVLDTEPYALDSGRSYCWNENTAYDAGIRLLRRTLGKLRESN